MIKRFTIIGNPIEHSVSPSLFRAAYSTFPKLIYDRNLVQSAEEGIALFRSTYLGGNVTSPFKEDILKLVDEVSEGAQIIGAANEIIVQANGAIRASNTDYLGVSGSFAEHQVTLSGKRCVLLGIGGAGKAAAYALQQSNADLTIVNRTELHAQEYARKMGCDWAPMADLEELVREAEVIVNTLYPSVDIVEEAWFNSKQTVLDASYIGSNLLDKAKRCSCHCIDGRYWVFHQALPAFVRFTGIRPDQQAMRKLLNIQT